jgi:UPF0042 nucleotide-binding protein
MRNPHSIADLRELTGRDRPVQSYVRTDPRFKPIIDEALHEAGLGRSIAFGCYGGKHRSVAMAEILAEALRKAGHDVAIQHIALGVTA